MAVITLNARGGRQRCHTAGLNGSSGSQCSWSHIWYLLLICDHTILQNSSQVTEICILHMCCTLPPLDLFRKLVFLLFTMSISPTPAPDLFDKPRQTTSLCKWLESVFKHWHQLETLYSPLCLTRQGFPDVTNTNIDTFSLIPQRLALSQISECGH